MKECVFESSALFCKYGISHNCSTCKHKITEFYVISESEEDSRKVAGLLQRETPFEYTALISSNKHIFLEDKTAFLIKVGDITKNSIYKEVGSGNPIDINKNILNMKAEDLIGFLVTAENKNFSYTYSTGIVLSSELSSYKILEIYTRKGNIIGSGSIFSMHTKKIMPLDYFYSLISCPVCGAFGEMSDTLFECDLCKTKMQLFDNGSGTMFRRRALTSTRALHSIIRELYYKA